MLGLFPLAPAPWMEEELKTFQQSPGGRGGERGGCAGHCASLPPELQGREGVYPRRDPKGSGRPWKLTPPYRRAAVAAGEDVATALASAWPGSVCPAGPLLVQFAALHSREGVAGAGALVSHAHSRPRPQECLAL
jgi:hypothetical protein